MAVDDNVLIMAAFPNGVQKYLGCTVFSISGERLQNSRVETAGSKLRVYKEMNSKQSLNSDSLGYFRILTDSVLVRLQSFTKREDVVSFFF